MDKLFSAIERLDPEDKKFIKSKWTSAIKERYYLASLFCKKKHVLETCSGSGWGAVNFIAPISASITGFDKSDCSIKKYPKIKKVKFKIQDVRNLKYEGKKYDVILALESIEHFSHKDGLKYLNGIKKLCKTDGIVIGTTPLVFKKSIIPILLRFNKFHLKMYTYKELKSTLKKFFPYVKIYKIYNRGPYFFFVCSSKNIKIKGLEKLHKFIAKKRIIYKINHFILHLYWTKELIKTFKIKDAITFFLSLS